MISAESKTDESVIIPVLEEIAEKRRKIIKRVKPGRTLKKLPRVDPWAIALTLAILAGTYTMYRHKNKIEVKTKGTEYKGLDVNLSTTKE